MHTGTLQFLAAMLACWMNEQLIEVNEYLREENRVLKEQFGGRKLRLNDSQRRRLAELGKRLGRRLLTEYATIVTPDTILRWHRNLIARKYDGSCNRRRGRPGVMAEIRHLTIRIATENRNWGYDKIVGALGNVGHTVHRSTVRRILDAAGLPPVDDRARHTPWKTFLKAHFEHTAAADFFTVEVWTLRGLTRFHVLFVIDLPTRAVHIAGIAHEPNGDWMQQIGRQLTDMFDGVLMNTRYLIHDRDPLFTAAFKRLLADAGVACKPTAPRAPNMNAYAERFVRSIRNECLDRIVPIGERHLWHVINEYVEHYNHERNHQGIGNVLIDPIHELPSVGEIQCDERLGGMLKSYRRAA